ncbi:DNA (cytosine-5-)-methyltransferase [Bacillus licheniformis]|uniref:DNA (cytosine-5-)-methyltransferase n=1 Tax=Bacillus licheniformis TaxID=1402 RepID=UPI0011A39076|nr:DNA (cytosine-5-)-methyltransferase [Bacillus licheniformis]MBU8564304.1 DNA (cytosine-5-)-methyltransferase [Bacillus licheniformis]MDE1367175.1 DNA (cytosine-5-)-methyltransferase [Bacillus licheniformis]MDE1437405.1 DNA (cytosine-5-)-methyltransferase [Bacillus licheniformis]MEC1244947.1 DNA (cytosine-5-)-methyltransferase [Bacillus licheniformis]MEC1326215.1 DNA (cytosine-5-)-methyltransferase [Bacillus licheniformis]
MHHGGKREGSGRTPLPANQKKIAKTIYITPTQHEDIETYAKGNSFSEKCIDLISTQLERRKRSENKEVKFIDLFAGLGGIRLGFENAFREKGFEPKCVFSSELKDYAIKAYKNYFKDTEVSGDITKIPAQNIEDFDFLLAGFPCQPFSAAGLQLGFEDTRGTLFFEIERILEAKKPYGFLLENVEGLVKHDNGRTLSIIVSRLKKLNYYVSYKLIDSKYFGLAQSRKRVYIVGTKDAHISLDNFEEHTAVLGDILDHNLPTVESTFTRKLFEHFTPKEVIGKAIKDKRGGNDNIHSWEIGLKGETTPEQTELLNLLLRERRKKKWAAEIGIDWMDGMPLTEKQIATFYPKENLREILDELVEMGYLTLEYPRKRENNRRVPDETKPKGYNIVTGKLSFEFTKILDPNDLAPTLVAMDVSRLGVIDNGGLRRLTIREIQRLFGFPDDYDLSFLKESEAFDLLGNTVCVPVIHAISERLADMYKA